MRYGVFIRKMMIRKIIIRKIIIPENSVGEVSKTSKTYPIIIASNENNAIIWNIVCLFSSGPWTTQFVSKWFSLLTFNKMSCNWFRAQGDACKPLLSYDIFHIWYRDLHHNLRTVATSAVTCSLGRLPHLLQRLSTKRQFQYRGKGSGGELVTPWNEVVLIPIRFVQFCAVPGTGDHPFFFVSGLWNRILTTNEPRNVSCSVSLWSIGHWRSVKPTEMSRC